MISLVDPDLPISQDGTVYHLACTHKNLADKFILVGDPGRVATVAEYLDPGSIEFKSSHREIKIITGQFKKTRVSVLSTGMGTDNMEIILNEIHALKEYNIDQKQWLSDFERRPEQIHLIRVGTCGSPLSDIQVGTLAITDHALGLDNTCRYYLNPHPPIPSVVELETIANKTALGSIGIYASRAHPDITRALIQTTESKSLYRVGTTASCSGFYACQGRAVGRFRGHLTIPNIVEILAKIPNLVNIEMENSALCFLSHILGYKAGTVCSIIARRSGNTREFASPEILETSIRNAIQIGLEALIQL